MRPASPTGRISRPTRARCWRNLQVEAGAKGITCQKLGEAEVMAEAGIDDILISYNLIGEEKMARLGALQAKANMTVACRQFRRRSPVCRRPPPRQAARSRWWWNATPGASAPASRRRRKPLRWRARSRRSKGLKFAGFMLYPTETGWVEAQKFFDEALAGVRAHGLDATMVSTGGTPNMKNVGKLKGATEHRPGTYIYNDRMQVAAGVAGWDDCALNIYSTVVSRAGPDRGILDAGSKTLTSDTGGAGRPRPDPRTSRSEDRPLCRGAWLSRPRPQQHPAQYRRRRADRAQSRMRRRQHDGRGGDGARRRDHRHAAGRGARQAAVGFRFSRSRGRQEPVSAIGGAILYWAMVASSFALFSSRRWLVRIRK